MLHTHLMKWQTHPAGPNRLFMRNNVKNDPALDAELEDLVLTKANDLYAAWKNDPASVENVFQDIFQLTLQELQTHKWEELTVFHSQNYHAENTNFLDHKKIAKEIAKSLIAMVISKVSNDLIFDEFQHDPQQIMLISGKFSSEVNNKFSPAINKMADDYNLYNNRAPVTADSTNIDNNNINNANTAGVEKIIPTVESTQNKQTSEKTTLEENNQITKKTATIEKPLPAIEPAKNDVIDTLKEARTDLESAHQNILHAIHVRFTNQQSLETDGAIFRAGLELMDKINHTFIHFRKEIVEAYKNKNHNQKQFSTEISHLKDLYTKTLETVANLASTPEQANALRVKIIKNGEHCHLIDFQRNKASFDMRKFSSAKTNTRKLADTIYKELDKPAPNFSAKK